MSGVTLSDAAAGYRFRRFVIWTGLQYRVPWAADRNGAASYAQITPGRLIEARPVGDDFLKDIVVLVSIRAYAASEELDRPDAAMPCPGSSDRFRLPSRSTVSHFAVLSSVSTPS